MGSNRKAFAARREAMGFTQESFGEATGVEFSTVGRWERGVMTPQSWRRPRIAKALAVSLDELNALLGQVRVPARGSQDLVAIDRRASEQEQAWRSSPMAASDSPRVGPNLEDVLSHLREQWHLLVKTDNLLGPRYALAGVLSQLDAIDELLASARPDLRRDIVRAGAQYAESASWLYEDMCDVTAARRWCSQSLEWGLEADDQLMVTWALFRRSQQVAEGNAGQILSLVRAAWRASHDLPTPMRAALAQQEAYGLALNGDELQAQTRIDEAQNWAAIDIHGEARGGHGSFCTPDYLEVQRARCWLALGNPARAIELYEHHVPRLPAVYQRDRGAALGQLAQAYVTAGEPEQAASVAAEALRIGRSGRSLRTVADVEAVGARLKDHDHLVPVSLLVDELAAG